MDYCDEHVINDKYWDDIEHFVKTDVIIEKFDTHIIGYFPTKIARIRPAGVSQTYLPVEMFENFISELKKHDLNQERVVYICKPIKTFTGVCPFAIWVREDYIMFGIWASVVSHSNKTLQRKK